MPTNAFIKELEQAGHDFLSGKISEEQLQEILTTAKIATDYIERGNLLEAEWRKVVELYGKDADGFDNAVEHWIEQARSYRQGTAEPG